MSKKPTFITTREQRLAAAKQELQNEEKQLSSDEQTVQTTLILEESLLYEVKDVLLQRKKAKIKPDTLTGVVREFLKEWVSKEKHIKA